MTNSTHPTPSISSLSIPKLTWHTMDEDMAHQVWRTLLPQSPLYPSLAEVPLLHPNTGNPSTGVPSNATEHPISNLRGVIGPHVNDSTLPQAHLLAMSHRAFDVYPVDPQARQELVSSVSLWLQKPHKAPAAIAPIMEQLHNSITYQLKAHVGFTVRQSLGYVINQSEHNHQFRYGLATATDKELISQVAQSAQNVPELNTRIKSNAKKDALANGVVGGLITSIPATVGSLYGQFLIASDAAKETLLNAPFMDKMSDLFTSQVQGVNIPSVWAVGVLSTVALAAKGVYDYTLKNSKQHQIQDIATNRIVSDLQQSPAWQKSFWDTQAQSFLEGMSKHFLSRAAEGPNPTRYPFIVGDDTDGHIEWSLAATKNRWLTDVMILCKSARETGQEATLQNLHSLAERLAPTNDQLGLQDVTLGDSTPSLQIGRLNRAQSQQPAATIPTIAATASKLSM